MLRAPDLGAPAWVVQVDLRHQLQPQSSQPPYFFLRVVLPPPVVCIFFTPLHRTEERNERKQAVAARGNAIFKFLTSVSEILWTLAAVGHYKRGTRAGNCVRPT